MSKKYPIMSITGSSGAGTSFAQKIFHNICEKENIKPAEIEGDAFHKYDRAAMKEQSQKELEKGNHNFSHFGLDANILDKLEETMASYSKTGTGKTRTYIHNDEEAEKYGCPSGTFTPWRDLDADSDMLFYEGLHGAVGTDSVNIAQYVDLKLGIVPIVNLEWIQKIYRDHNARGYSHEAITDTILRRMPDYVNVICPQFKLTDINFQRAPVIDTSYPFDATSVPGASESIVIISFKDTKNVDFLSLLSLIHESYMSNAHTIVVPGGKFELALELILTPILSKMISESKKLKA